ELVPIIHGGELLRAFAGHIAAPDEMSTLGATIPAIYGRLPASVAISWANAAASVARKPHSDALFTEFAGARNHFRGGAFFDTKQEGAAACRDQNITGDSPTSVCSLPCCRPIRRPSSCWSSSLRSCRPKPTTLRARRISLSRDGHKSGCGRRPVSARAAE